MRMVLVAGSLFLASCVEAPSLAPDATRPPALAAGTALAAGCAGGETVVTWTVSTTPDLASYAVWIAADAELERIDIEAEGPGSQPLATSTVEACASGCTATLVGMRDGAAEPLLTVDFGVDLDGDGFSASACGGDDCADDDDAVNPAADESCDGVDNNCSGVVDDLPDAPLADLQEGVCAGAIKVCDGSGGWDEPDYALVAGYETDELSCDGLDNDCDGVADTDIATAPAATLQDGVCAGAVQVCDGSNGWVEPDYTEIADYEATEASCDGLDNDCSGQADDLAGAPDADEQRGVCAGAKKVCDGSGGWVEPDYTALADYEADELSCDGLDNDCDDIVDTDIATAPAADDQDGVCAGAVKVCDGSHGWIEPDYADLADYEATEATCDGLDNDCSGTADDILDPPLADVQAGVCTGATKVCDGSGWQEPDYARITGYEADELSCDGLDNDCDEATDTDIATAPAAAEQDGVCAGAVQVCNGTDWAEPTAADLAAQFADYEPTELSCDGLDNDCGGTADDIAPADAPPASKTAGVCAGATRVCTEAGWTEPDYTRISGYEPLELSCDDLDNDCDDLVDTITEIDPNSGELFCWGDYPSRVVEWRDPGPWTSLSLTKKFGGSACAIDTAGGLSCWGYNYEGELGDGTSGDERRTIEPVSGDATWKAVSINGRGTCGIQDDDSLWCWGYRWGSAQTNSWGHTPTRVGTGTWTRISRGEHHTCAIDTNQAVWCWGVDDSGELGEAAGGVDQADPVLAATGSFVDVSAGTSHTCALDTAGTVHCWGSNDATQLATTGVSSSAAPIAVPPPTDLTWIDVDAGQWHSCALDSSGAAWCWGANYDQQLGDGTSTSRSNPVKVSDGPYEHIEGSYYRTCAVGATVGLDCWGYTGDRSGTGEHVDFFSTPTSVDPALGAGLSVGEESVCALDGDGALWCWGWNPDTGPGPNQVRSFATQAVSAISSGGNGFEPHHCYIDASDGSLWCLGANGSGQLGLGERVDALAPRQVSPGPFVAVSGGDEFTCALDADGARWCWGRNNSGQLGDGTTTERLAPWQASDGPWSALDTSSRQTCAVLASDGTLWCWGQTYAETPQQLGTEAWRDVAVGQGYVCAIATDDTLACWGSNASGRLGDGTTTTRTYAERYLHAGAWKEVVAQDGSFTCGIRDDDTLWCWGLGAQGTLGQGEEASSTVPVQVPGSWKDITVGDEHTCGVQTDGTLWCWGRNRDNQRAQPYADPDWVTSPMQMPGTGWSEVGAAGDRTCASQVRYTTSECPP